MKSYYLVMLAFFVPWMSMAQSTGNNDNRTAVPGLAFDHLADGLRKSTDVPHSICPSFYFYQNGPNPTYFYYQENLPISTEWAIKLTIPQSSGATKCTVWTQLIDFELLNSTLFDRDTIRFYVREAAPPYTVLYSTWFIARQGINHGLADVEIPAVPPFVRPVINPIRDILLGYKVIGQSNHAVKWKFTTPSLYPTAPRSFKVTPSGLIPASTVVGQSVDWINEVVLCCDRYPVELSAFTAQIEGETAMLRWRTETETNNFHFQLQRGPSPEGPWETRAFLPGHGTTTQPQEYVYRDPFSLAAFAGSTPVLWYRLRQQDFDGTIHDHPPMQVHLSDLSMLGFDLGPVYPNPLSVSGSQLARVRYRVPDERRVRLTVHDMLGREISVLADNIHAAGVYESAWTPVTEQGLLTSGTYMVRLLSDGVSLSRNISVIR